MMPPRLAEELFGAARIIVLRTDEAAQDRATALLREWLTPAQLRQFDADGCFEVVGNNSGLRYRLKAGRVDALDRDGCEIFGLCFHPGGRLASGDVMLAQKIAIESDENATLAVTNFIPRRRSW